MAMYAVLKKQVRTDVSSFFGFIDLTPVELDQFETTSGDHMISGIFELDLATGERKEFVLNVLSLRQVTEKFDDIRYMSNLENSEFAHNGKYYYVSSKQRAPLKLYLKNKSQYLALQNWMSDIENAELNNILKVNVINFNEKVQFLNETEYSFLNASSGDLFYYVNASDKDNIQEKYIKFEYLTEFNAKGGVMAMCSVWDQENSEFKSPVNMSLDTSFKSHIALKHIGQVYDL